MILKPAWTRAVLLGVIVGFGFPFQRVCGFDQDGKTDLVWRNAVADKTIVWSMPEVHYADISVLNTGSRPVVGIPLTNWQLAATADFDHNGQTDLLFRNPATGENTIWLMNGTNLVSSTVVQSACCADWVVVGTGDFDGDGYPDILWRNAGLNLTYVWYMEGTVFRTAALITKVPPNSSWQATAVGDFNNDGHPDIVWHSPIEKKVVFWYMDNTNFLSDSAVNLYPGGPGFVPVTAGPFNVIGNDDLVWRGSNGQNYIWWMRDNFVLKTFQLPDMPYPAWQIGGAGPDGNPLEIAATAGSSPAALTLHWRLGDGRPVTVQRRTLGSSGWTTLQSNYRPPRLTNSDVTLGQRYEYKVGNETLLTAIHGTPVERRGKVLLVVADNIASALATELEILHTNLVGDGWTVVRTNVPAHDDSNWASNVPVITSIKRFITNTYNASPVDNRPQAALLIGHVPVPHSGYPSPDGHGNRCLPADMYYGDVDGLWTDTNIQTCILSFNCTNTIPPDCSCGFCDPIRHDNLAGDGKWDQTTCPPNAQGLAAFELVVGRIDCANLPAFAAAPIGKSELDLLRQYLNKDDRYRRKVVPLQERVMTGAYFGTFNQQGFPVVPQGMRVGSRFFGFAPEKIINGDGFYPANGCTWAIQGGFGMPHHIQGSNSLFHAVTTANNLAASDFSFIAPGTEPQGGFFCLYGSCFLDHFYQNNLMRSLIAVGTDYNLGAMWFKPFEMTLEFDRVALGETVGSGFLRTVNDVAFGVANTYLAWIGDPTLRVQVLAPPTKLSASRNINNPNNVDLTWTGSTEATQYFVYRSTTGLDGTFSSLTTNAPISGIRYMDTNASSGAIYMVRALNLRTTASGSFTNLSQGIFATVNARP